MNYQSDADFLANLAAREKSYSVIKKASSIIAQRLKGVDTDQVAEALEFFWTEFSAHRVETIGIEKAAKAKKDLLDLAEKAEQLEAVIQNLGQGAVEVMNHQTASIQLVKEAEPGYLPDKDPWGPNLEPGDDTYSRGGRWAIRLRALAKLARERATWIQERTAKGGRKTLAPHLHETPKELLAQTCQSFAAAHGCKQQAVVLLMVRAVLEAEYGKGAMTRLDGKPAAHMGRKAVRKAAQTRMK